MIGLHIMRPTSVVVAGAGSSASIRSDGGVDFSSATSLSLNGVFTATYDNYVVVMNLRANTSNADVQGRLRLAGTDESGSNYTVQELAANNTSVTGVRLASQTTMIVCTADNLTERSGVSCYIYGPNLAQPTAFRSVGMRSASGAWVQDRSATHSVSTAYDGMSLIASGGSLTGAITVYGMAQ